MAIFVLLLLLSLLKTCFRQSLFFQNSKLFIYPLLRPAPVYDTRSIAHSSSINQEVFLRLLSEMLFLEMLKAFLQQAQTLRRKPVQWLYLVKENWSQLP